MDTDKAIIRTDRVGLYKLGVVSKVPIPLTPPDYYDMSLTVNGTIGMSKVKRYSKDWPPTSIFEVSEVREVGLREAMTCYQGVAPSRILHMRVRDDRYLVLFTGITRFLSGGEKLVSYVPGVHHAGALIVGMKSAIDNRGSKARAIEARDLWLKLLTGNIQLSDLGPSRTVV